MAHFEIDLPTPQAAQFDKLLTLFVGGELMGAEDVDVQATSYSVGSGVERRYVFMSSPVYLDAFTKQWEAKAQRAPLA